MAGGGLVRRSTVLGAVGCLIWVVFLIAIYTATAPTDEPPVTLPPPVVTIEPIETYDSDELRALLAELRDLRESRLTPEERDAVSQAAEIVDDIADGNAGIAPSPTTTTSTTTTTTAPPPTTEPPVSIPSVSDMTDALLDQLTPDQ